MRYRKRLIVIGGGPDVVVGRGIASPGTSTESGRGTVRITVAVTEEACRSGIRVFQLLRTAIRTRKIQDVARLRLYFPEIVERAPVFHAFLDRLYLAGKKDNIVRILGGPHRGRKLELPRLAA